MPRTYMRLDERPEPPQEKERPSFDDRRKYFSHYPSMRHESQVVLASWICIVILLIGLALFVVSMLLLFKVISIDWSFIRSDDFVRWMDDYSLIMYTAVAALSAVQIESALIAAVCGFKQEDYSAGLLAYVLMTISSAWTIVLPVASIILMIYYMKAKGSFFS